MSTPAAPPQQGSSDGPTQQPSPPTPPAPKPYEPTPEEQTYLLECAAAITAGCDAAVEAAKVDEANGAEYLAYANGVKSLTAAYIEIKTGGKAATGHQGS